MSGIFGVLRSDGEMVAARALSAMADALRHRAVDGIGSETLGPVGLGQCRRHAMREDHLDAQPIHDDRDSVVLVADMRLDNRDALAEAMGITSNSLATLPDSALAMRAYLRWGSDFVHRLLGDFAIGIWDERIRRLLLVRDPMGQRPLFYHHGAGLFAFAAEPKGLWAISEVPREITDAGIARRLMSAIGAPSGETAFTEVRTLPGGHTLSISLNGEATLDRYWHPQPDPKHLDRDEAYYVRTYRAVLAEAVACRIRRLDAPPGLLMSGGFDSAAIAGLAGPVLDESGNRLIAASAVMPAGYDGPLPDPRKWVERCARVMPWLDVRYVTRDGRDALQGLERRLAERQLGATAQWFAQDALYAELARAGVRVALDGYGGDYTLNPRGKGAVGRWLKMRRFGRFYRELCAHLRHSGQGPYATARNLADQFAPHLMARLRIWRRDTPPWDDAAVQPAFAREMIASGAIDLTTLSTAYRDQTALRDRLLAGVERASASTAGMHESHYGLTITRPFLDVRVVELALAIPEDLYLKDGRNRYLACMALADVYPPEFQTRSRRNDGYVPDMTDMIGTMTPRLLAEATRLERSPQLARYIDFARVRTLLEASPGTRDQASGAHLALSTILAARYIEAFRRDNG